MKSQDRKFSLSNDRATALELLSLQEAAQLANEQLTAPRGFGRNDKISHVVHASLNIAQFVTALTDEVFHVMHHAINREMHKKDPSVPSMPEERNPIFYVYPICIGISLILCMLWLTTRFLYRYPLAALGGNFVGGFLIMTGGISAMRHAEKHINLEQISDEELIRHPIFIHNFTMCILSIFCMILYAIPTWILLDYYKWRKRPDSFIPIDESRRTDVARGSPSPSRFGIPQIGTGSFCSCSHSRNKCSAYAGSPSRSSQLNSSWSKNTIANEEMNVQDEPVILYCCCVDLYRYMKSSGRSENLTHEFQVIQVM